MQVYTEDSVAYVTHNSRELAVINLGTYVNFARQHHEVYVHKFTEVPPSP
jgi:hypothetical protein